MMIQVYYSWYLTYIYIYISSIIIAHIYIFNPCNINYYYIIYNNYVIFIHILECISRYYNGRDRSGYTKLKKEFNLFGKCLLNIIRNNSNITKHGTNVSNIILEQVHLKEHELKTMFYNAMCIVIPNNLFNNYDCKIITTIYNGIIHKVIHQRSNQIIKTYREENLTRSINENKGATLRESLKIITGNNKKA